MAVVTTRQLLESGVHFGHQTRRWNPKMKRFIFTERNGIYIIDLQQSLTYIDRAYAFVKQIVSRGGQVLFIGTKKQAQEAIAEQATRVGMPYVNHRWLGGMLTNFHTIGKRTQRLKELEGMDFTNVAASGLTKKELLGLSREKDKLDKTLGGIRDMAKLPQAVWIVDTKKEHLAVDEARKLRIPVIGILDTNCDPDEVDFAIPGNDDAIRSVALLTRVLADAVADGLMARSGGSTADEEAEPMPDWERELLASGQDDAEPSAEQAGAEGLAPTAGEAAPVEAAPVEAAPVEAAPADAAPADPAPKPSAPKPSAPKPAAPQGSAPTGGVSAADVKRLRDATGAGMVDAKKALGEADGDFDKAVELLRVAGQAKNAKRQDRTATNGVVAASGNTLIQLAAETDFVAKSEVFGKTAAAVVEAVAKAGASSVADANQVEVDGKTVAELISEAGVTLGEKVELANVATFEGTTAVYLHRRASDLPPQVGVLVEYTGDDEAAARGAAMQIAAMRPQYLNRDEVPVDVVDAERRIAEANAREQGKPEQAIGKIVDGRVNAFYGDTCLLDQASVTDPKQKVGAQLEKAGITVTRFARFEAGA